MMMCRKELLPGVYLTTLRTDKFKSDCLSVSLLAPLDAGTISMNALLPRVLARGTALHPELNSLAEVCDELYGARVIPVVRKKGEILALGFYAGFISDRFTPGGETLLESVAALLGELLLSPATRAGLLRKDYVESEKEKLTDDIRARINDKRSYAVYRLVQEMCAYEPYGIDDMGTEEGAHEVTYLQLTRYYRELLRKSPIELFYCGDALEARVERALRDALSTLPRGELDEEIGTDIRLNTVEAEPRYFDETLDVGQGKLCLGFRLGNCMEEPDFAAIRVFNALYGGSVNSRLFLNVREKLSLCYYASSGCDTRKGIMLVSSGIEPANYDIAREEILSQLEELRRGDFTEEELSAARATVASDLRALTDSPGAMEDFYLSQTLIGLDMGPMEMAALCEEVTADDVTAVASDIALDAVYFLHGQDTDDDAESESEEEEEDEADA